MNVEPLASESAVHPAASSAGLQAFGDASAHLAYAAAPGGVDANLVVFLHGLGDRAAPFLELGTKLQRTLPQTAVLSVQGLKRVPMLEEDAWMWWDTFDMLGELLPRPDPRKAIAEMRVLLAYLSATTEQGGCGWPAENIHLFGYGQGGTLALETVVAQRGKPLGSVTSVGGPFLSHPTFAPPLDTPICFVTRFAPAVLASSPQARTQLTDVHKAFAHVTHLNFPSARAPMDEAMIQGKEWDALHTFWSKLWRHRSAWERSGDVYKVT